MKKLKPKIFFIVFFLILVIPFNSILNSHKSKNMNLFELSKNDSLWIKATLNSMSLEEKCAQLIIPFVPIVDRKDTFHFNRIIYLATKLKVGGFLFLKGDLEIQKKLIDTLKSVSEIPLIFAADYERGAGMRTIGATEYPYNMGVAAINDPLVAYNIGKQIAEEAKYIGINLNLAPLLDINLDYRNPIIDIRSFSEMPEMVTNLSVSFISGLQENGVAATVKHFPGHGATNIDSHSNLPVIKREKKDLWENEIIPFKFAIKNGVKCVMPGHLSIPAFESDENLPATFSKKIISEILRERLGFKGVVLTDAMNMSAITNKFSQAEAAVKAIQAGNDMILFPSDEWQAYTGILNAVRNKQISENRINESLKRILSLKCFMLKYSSSNKKAVKPNFKKHRRYAEYIAQKSITLIKDSQKLIPINSKYYSKVACVSIADNKFKSEPLFTKKIKNEFADLVSFEIDAKEKLKNINGFIKKIKDADLIILPIYIYAFSLNKKIEHLEKLSILIGKILRLNKPTIVISFGTPYLINELPEIETYLCAYGETKVSQSAAVNAILGFASITGKLPVSIPGNGFKFGFGLERIKKNVYSKEIADSNYNLKKIDLLMKKGIANHIFPGATLYILHRNRTILNRAYGNFTYDPKSPKVKLNTIYDLASLTKVIVTTSVAMHLFDLGKFRLEDFVSDYLPEFAVHGKDSVRIENLLLHNSGLPAFFPFYKICRSKKDVLNKIYNLKLKFSPGEKYLYSDLGMVVLQQVLEKISNTTLDQYFKNYFSKPLKLTSTFFNPSAKIKQRIAPTENDGYWRNRVLQGTVHDETAAMLDGVSGNAGLFSNSIDLATFMQMILNNGKVGKIQLIKAETILKWRKSKNKFSSRAYGWDTNKFKNSSAGKLFSQYSFGHTGFTGTSIWADPKNELCVILLSNRIYPSRTNKKIVKFRKMLHNEIFNLISN